MILEKYRPLVNNLFEFIRNKITVGTDIDEITTEALERFSPELIFWDVSEPMLREWIQLLAEYAYFMYNNIFYKN